MHKTCVVDNVSFNKHLHACDANQSAIKARVLLVVATGGRKARWSLSSSVVGHSGVMANCGHHAEWAQHAVVTVPWPRVA